MPPLKPKATQPQPLPAARLPRTLQGCRRQIDQIDRQLIELLDQRAQVALRVGEIKHKAGREMFDAGRHIQKLNQLSLRGAGVFPSEGLRRVFGEILSACLAMEAPQTIGFLGPEGTFSHIAAMRVYGRSVNYQPYASIPDIFHAVEKDWVNFGIVPIENSTGGMVHTTLDELIHSPLLICAELHIAVHHNLICRGPIEGIQKVCTHPQILSQCREWLRANLPNAVQVETASSGEGIKLAKRNKTVAGIGPEYASQSQDVPILVRRIEDQKDNITRFLILGRQSPAPSGHDKTSVMFSIKDQPGALDQLIKPFSKRGLNLTKIESRPSRRRAWDYIFFVDIEGHMSDPRLHEALREVEPHTTYLRVLGSYPIDIYGRRLSYK